MTTDRTENSTFTGTYLSRLDDILHDKEHLLIIAHNHPDPDAIASAAALSYLVEKKHSIEISIAYGGLIGRAENRAMVKKLDLRMKNYNRIKRSKYDCLALVDGQPFAGNTPNLPYNIVIDHHPLRSDTKADLIVVEPEIGVTATLLVEWLNESMLDISANLATALAYAFISETQNLGRETCSRDISAYLDVYTKAKMRLLAEILQPKLPQSYFYTLAKTLHRAYSYKNLICAHMGEIPNPEIAAEMADFLLRRERISWSFCTGIFKDQLILSIRSSNPKARAGILIKEMHVDPDNVGGHDQMAGGYIVLKNRRISDIEKLQEELSMNFAGLLGHSEVRWKTLLDLNTIIYSR